METTKSTNDMLVFYESIANLKKLGFEFDDDALKELADIENDLIHTQLLDCVKDNLSSMLDPIQRKVSVLVEHEPGEELKVSFYTPKVKAKPLPPAPVPTPVLAKFKGGYTKDPSIPFAVEFPDGDIIAEKKAVKTFIKSLQKLDLVKVQHVGIEIKGYNLVSNIERPRVGKNKWQDYVDRKYIYTKLSNPQKINYLYRIAKALGIKINIYDI